MDSEERVYLIEAGDDIIVPLLASLEKRTRMCYAAGE